MRIQESLVTDKQIALELYSENGKYRLPIDGKDYYFPTLEKVHEAFLDQNTYDTIKLTYEGKKSYLHLFMDEIEVFDTKKALRQRLSQDSQGMWAEIRNGKKHYYMEERGWMSTSYIEITEKECIEKLQHTSTMTKVLGIGLGMLALLPGAVDVVRHFPSIGTKEAAMGLIALNQKSPVLGAVGCSLLPKQVEALAVGTEFQVNNYTASRQVEPSMAPLNDGGFVVTWESYGQDGDSYGIYGQRYARNGSVAGTEFLVNTYTTNSQTSPSIASLNNGGFVVTWESSGQDGDLGGVYGQRYDSSGGASGAEFQVNTYTTNNQRYQSVAPLNDGGFVVTWVSFGQDKVNSYGVYGQRYDTNGMTVGSEFQVNTYTTSSQHFPNVAPLKNGGFVVVWTSYGQDGDSNGIFGQRYDSNGSIAGTEFQVNSYITGDQNYPSVAPLNDDGFIIAWESNQDVDGYGIYAQRYDSIGAAVGSEFQINTYTTSSQKFPSIAPLNDGGFVVTWQSREQDGSDYGIYGQRYDNTGSPAGSEFKVNTYTANVQQSPSIAPLNDGGFVITWESSPFLISSWTTTTNRTGQDGDYGGIFGQRYDASGNPIPLQLSASTTTTQSPFSGSTAPPSNSPSPTPAGTTSMVPSSTMVPTTTVASPSPSPTPNTSTLSPSNPPSVSLLTTGSSLTSSSPTRTNTPSPTLLTSSTTFTTTLTSALPSSNNQAAMSTPSSSKAHSPSLPSEPTTSTPTIVAVENIVYGESYPLLINDEVVGSYTVSGGNGSVDSGNFNVISFDFDPSFEPEVGDVITLFYLPEEDVALWESIEIEGESFECLTTYGQIVTNDGLSSFQAFFEDTECVAIAPTMLATALPLTLN